MSKAFEYLVESVMPSREIHLIGGPSGGGKTTWLFQFLQAWSRGEDIWGYHSYPVPYRYISLDRSADGQIRTLERMKIAPGSIPSFPAFEYPILETMEQILTAAKQADPSARLFIVEGIAGKVPNHKVNDYGVVAKFLTEQTKWCQTFDSTIIGVVHASKTKANEGYDNPRQRILGSVAWAAFSETIIGLEPVDAKDPECKLRRLYLLPRNAPEQAFDLEWQDGLLVPASADTMANKRKGSQKGRPNDALKEAIVDIQNYLRMEQIREIKFGDLAEAIRIRNDKSSIATITRAVRTLVEAGKLRPVKKGHYEVIEFFNDPFITDVDTLPPRVSDHIVSEFTQNASEEVGEIED